MNFNLVQIKSLTSVPTVIYKNNTKKAAIAISVCAAATMTDITQTVYLSVKLRTNIAENETTIESFVFNNIPLIFGSSIVLPKVCITPGSELIAYTDTPGTGCIDFSGSVLEISSLTIDE